jgi:hypothetical protein
MRSGDYLRCVEDELMPYIKQTEREDIASGDIPCTTGQLNYAFTSLAQRYIQEKGKSYGTFNDVLGALEGAKQEFYRRVVVPYEEGKIKENGDVYE